MLVREALCRYERAICWVIGAFFRSNRALFRPNRFLSWLENCHLRLAESPFRQTKAPFLSKRALRWPVRVLFWHGKPFASFLGAFAGLKGPTFGLRGSSFGPRMPTFSLWESLRPPNECLFWPTKVPSCRQRALSWPERDLCWFGRLFVSPTGPSVGLKNPLSV